MYQISIVVPTYNGEDCLPALAAQISKDVSLSHELILVNDGSPDNTWKVITELVEKYPNMAGINLLKNAGQDNALMAGLAHAKGEYVVIMDDDLQHDPSDIPLLYQKCKEGFDVCYANYMEKKQQVWKNFGSWFNGKIAQWFLKKPKALYLSPYKIIKKEIVSYMCSYTGPYPYIDGLILSITANITQIFVKHNLRVAGQSSYGLIKSLKVWSSHFTGFSVMPLRIATVSGFCAAAFGFILGIYYIFEYFFVEQTVAGWTTLVVLQLFIGGMMLMALGMIGEYVGRSYMLLNRRAQYIIKEVIGTGPKKSEVSTNSRFSR